MPIDPTTEYFPAETSMLARSNQGRETDHNELNLPFADGLVKRKSVGGNSSLKDTACFLLQQVFMARKRTLIQERISPAKII